MSSSSTSTSLTLRALLKTASGRLGLGVPGRAVSGLTPPAKAWFAAAAAAKDRVVAIVPTDADVEQLTSDARFFLSALEGISDADAAQAVVPFPSHEIDPYRGLSPHFDVASARARADATSKCGDSPRYGSISWDGNGTTACAASASEIPSSADRKKRASEVSCSTSASVGTIATTRSFAAAAAANHALAGGVRPLTARPGTPRPRRPEAVFRRARRVSEVEVDDELMVASAAGAGTFNYRMKVRA